MVTYNNRVFFTSDTHYGHKNISGKSQSNWEHGYRNYESVDLMNKDLIIGINSIVGENDILYHLGDFSLGGFNKVLEFRESINCKTVHLILGNHDEKLNKKYSLESLFSSIKDVNLVNINGQKIFLSHYAHRVWNGKHNGVYHLYGHSHDLLDSPPNSLCGNSMDVGVESAIRIFGYYKPFSLEDIKNIFNGNL